VDTSFDRYAIETAVEIFNDPRVGCVSGNIGVRNSSASIVAKFQAIEYLLSISLGRQLADLLGVVTIASGAFSAFRRVALIAVGGWDVGPGEDASITLKLRQAGWKVRFASEAWALTDVPVTLTALLKQRNRWDASFVRIRLIRFKVILNPFSRNFSLIDAIAMVDGIFFQVVAPAAFVAYLITSLIFYGDKFYIILITISGFYVGLATLALICASAASGRYGQFRLLPYVIGYTIFRGYIMRLATTRTYVRELFLRDSYFDTFVPLKVQSRKP
jgi:cellulose synthase/poly-beta-1,6-N-acetylglucosamine synthase-like glycosyltransferase